MTKKMPAGEFKAHCLGLMEEVRRTKRSIIITKRNVPIAELIPLNDKRPSLFGCMKGSVEFLGDVIEPIGEAWDADS